MKVAGYVGTKYCMDSWSGTYGLMDEVLKKAEQENGIDYVKNASFTMEGDLCMLLEGTGYKFVR